MNESAVIEAHRLIARRDEIGEVLRKVDERLIITVGTKEPRTELVMGEESTESVQRFIRELYRNELAGIAGRLAELNIETP